MDRKTLIILIAGIIIIFCFVFGLSSKENENNETLENSQIQAITEVTYNEVTDEETGEKYYQIYDKNTGEMMRNVTDEASLKMYIDNPDFIGPENEGENEEEIIEYNEDGTIKENIEN